MTFESPDATAGESAKVDITELARLLGLSIGTVSRSLNNRPGVSLKTRKRVLAAAKEHRYSPSSAARQLKDRPSLLVGLFFAPYYSPNREINPSALGLIERLRLALKTQGVDLKVLYFKDNQDLKDQALEVNVGLFYGHFDESSFAVVHELGIPAILYDKQSAFTDQISVVADTRQSCNVAVQYLAALGHERIGMVTGPDSEFYYRAYKEAFVSSMQEFNLPLRTDWLFEQSAARCNQEGAYETLLPLLKKDDRPTALIFASDWLALGGRKAALAAGLSIPGDISLVGHDNLPITAELDPPLTTFDIHVGRVVQTLAQIAIQLGSHRRPPGDSLESRTVLLLPDFVKRSSCRSLRAAVPAAV
ncbi:MAG TPA: LacI family DNA-binding transcriptional regulator [Rariglobus sp.]|nr:LacI family DNA-binding transcriptional regulator [Rariglobus sp.]